MGEHWGGWDHKAFPGRTRMFLPFIHGLIFYSTFGGLSSVRPSLRCRVSTNIGNKHLWSPVLGT